VGEGDCLLQSCNSGQHIERLLTCDPPMISLSESIFKLVLQTQDTHFSGILNTFTYNNYSIINKLLDLMKEPDTCNDAVSFFCDCILVIHSTRIPETISSHFMDILSDHESLFTTLITSPSKRLQYNALKLTYHFLTHRCEIFAKPLIIPSLDIFFSSTRSNVLHYIISQIIHYVLTLPSDEYPSILLQKGQLTKRILKAYHSYVNPGLFKCPTSSGINPQSDIPAVSGNEHLGFLINISKWIMESPYGVKDNRVLTSTKWKSFYENFVIESIQKQGLLPPTIELRELNLKSKSTPSGEAI